MVPMAPPPFHRADVGACQPHAGGKGALGQPPLRAERTHGLAEELERVVRARSPCSHGVPVGLLRRGRST